MFNIRQDNNVLNADRADALKAYRADPEIVDAPDGTSKATTTDLMDTIEWVKPALLEIFAGGNEVTKLVPTGEEDVESVKRTEALTNYQMRIRNKWFQIMHDWIDDALKLKTGVIKYQWVNDVKFVEKHYEELSSEEYTYLAYQVSREYAALDKAQLADAPDQESNLTEYYNPLKGTMAYDVTFTHAISDEHPLIEAIPTEDFGFMHTLTREIEDAPFVYHKARYTRAKFIRTFGKAKFKEAENTLDRIGENTSFEYDGGVNYERLKELGGEFFHDKDTNEYFVYECYYLDEDTGKPMISRLSGGTELDYRKNEYDKPPFRVISPLRVAHRICGNSFHDLLKDLQRIRTAMIREFMNNMYFGNKKRAFIDTNRVNIDDYKNNRMGVLIRVNGDPRTAVWPEDKAPIPDGMFGLWSLLNEEKDYHSGVPRSFQGVNTKVLNKTARGQNQQINQASQRVKMLARIIAEIGVAPLVNDIIDLNIKFLKRKTAFRYLNKAYDISPDNIVAKYDITVNVGLGTGDKDQIVSEMQQLLGVHAQFAKYGVPVTSSRVIYNIAKELVKGMGYKNTSDFVEDPKYQEAVIALVQKLMQMQIPDPELEQLVARLLPQLSIDPKQVPEQQTEAALVGRMVPDNPATPETPAVAGVGGNGGVYE